MFFSYKGFYLKNCYEAMILKINRVSVILRTKYVPSFVKNPLKDVDSSVHKDASQNCTA
jgi:hypothetical protein